MKLKNFSPVVIALLVGAAIGYCFSPASEAPSAPEERKDEGVRRPRRESDGDRSANRALRARVKELEDLLAKQGVEVEKAKTDEGERRRFDPRAEMERLQKEDPARFSQMTNGMARWRQRRLERAQSKVDFLSSIDTSKMSPAALKTHNDLLAAIEKREQIEEKMRGMLDMSEDDRRAFFDEMRETDGQIRQLNKAERDNLLNQAAAALGFSGDDAKEIVSEVQNIYRMTESDRGPGGPGGPGGPDGNRGPGGNRRGGDRGGNR